MNHFIPKCVEYIYSRHSKPELADICVVLPTRRGVFFFKEALAKQADGPFIAPKILAVEDFILEATGLQLMEPIDLVFELFNAFKTVDQNAKFDLFMTWAPTLLKDFETIDQYLVDAKQLFSYMTEAEALKRWEITGWKNSETATSVSKYFELFKNLYEVYLLFNKNLKAVGKVYRGSAYRQLAENAETLLIENKTYTKFYFLGFNALSISENKIIKLLTDAKLAETLWDTDEYYMTSSSKGQLAGKFLKPIKSQATFGTNWNWQENNLKTGIKNIKIIEVPNASQQPKVASHYLQKWFSTKSNESTAIVLADENLLPTMLTHIPENVADYNITMGLSMKTSAIFSLIEAIFELQRFIKFDKKNNKKFNSRLIINLLNHPFLKYWAIENSFDLNEKIKTITSQNILFLGENEIEIIIQSEYLSNTFLKFWNDSTEIALKQLYKTSEFLQSFFDEKNNPLDSEFLFHYIKLLNRLEVIIKNNFININISGLKSILFELIRQTKLPFEGQHISQLQIMGMLETRTLDFDRIILLSVNENFLPTGKKSNTLIPFDALLAHEMPTYGHQDAVMAYHFFRLLQCAKEVVITYVSPKASYGGNEKSRFILQIEKELAKANSNITLEYPQIKFDKVAKQLQPVDFQIKKTEEIIDQIKTELKTKGLYATSINEYVACTMQYYFRRIVKLDQLKEIDDAIGPDKFGNWIHKTLENIDKEIYAKGGIVERDYLIEIKDSIKQRLIKDFSSIYENMDLDEGMNLIALNVAEKILKDYFSNEIEKGKFPQQIIGIEKSLSFDTKIDSKAGDILVKIGGKIDKIDKIENTIRIIDYKTGKVEKKDVNFSDKKLEVGVESFFTNKKFDKIRQLWLYRYLVLKDIENKNQLLINNIDENCTIETGIYSFRNNNSGFMDGFKSFSKDYTTDADFLEKSEELITGLVNELLDNTVSFQMTTDLATCELCSYKGLCSR